MNIRHIILAGALALGTFGMNAVPAKPGYHEIQQPDGSVVKARIVGDENFHYYETEAGQLMMSDATGRLRAVSREQVTAASAELFKQREDGMLRVAPKPITHNFPTTGEITGLILLVNYTDVKFSEGATKEHYEALCNQENLQSDLTTGSVLDYFKTQSNGKFTPKFDVFGPIELPRERAYYGMTTDGFHNQFRDACLEADKMGLDFSKYDINEDGFVDFLFVIYAGYGEAQGGPIESVWPAMQDLSYYVFDYFDGLNLGVAACSCELKGNKGIELDGIGTICHEFSHILGLADIYDTHSQGTEGYGMAHYDLMDIGSYNDDQRTPSGYTAMDKFTLGWIEPTVLEEKATDVCLHPFGDSHESIFIVNPDNSNEYFTLENRQKTGWDKGLPGHGLVISYCHYDRKYWVRNTLNAPDAAGYEHVTIIPADNIKSLDSEEFDPFPGNKGRRTYFPTKTNKAIWMSSGAEATFSITNIRETEEGDILFDFDPGVESGITIVEADGNGRQIYDLWGHRVNSSNLPAGIYIVRENGKARKITVNY